MKIRKNVFFFKNGSRDEIFDTGMVKYYFIFKKENYKSKLRRFFYVFVKYAVI